MATQKRSSKTSIRLNKFIADSGVASRRKADELIEEGKVRVNGKTIYEHGTKVSPDDNVVVSGKPLKGLSDKVYYIFNKPKQVVTSMSDPEGRPTVADYFKKVKTRIFPVGRLDWDTEGLLLMGYKSYDEAQELKKKYWGRHFWAIGYGCWSTGNITDSMVNEYLEHHRKPTDTDDSNFILD